MIYNIQAYSPVTNPASGDDGEPDCFLAILPAKNASLPAITAYFIAVAIMLGSFAQAIAVLISTPSQPSSIAIHASLAVPTPASTMIGTVAFSIISLMLYSLIIPIPEPIACAKEPIKMANAMKYAVIAGREALLAGRIVKKQSGSASSPKAGLVTGD